MIILNSAGDSNRSYVKVFGKGISATIDIPNSEGIKYMQFRTGYPILILIDKSNTNSIKLLVIRARENARGAQDHITKEVWEVVNQMYHQVNQSSLPSKLLTDQAIKVVEGLARSTVLFAGVTDKKANPIEYEQLERDRDEVKQELTLREGKPGTCMSSCQVFKVVDADVIGLAFTAPEVPSETERLYKQHREKLKSIKANKADAAKTDEGLAYLLQSLNEYDQWGEREKNAHIERNKECVLFSDIIFLITSPSF